MHSHLLIVTLALSHFINVVFASCEVNEYYHRYSIIVEGGECRKCPINSTSPLQASGLWECKCDDPTKDVIGLNCSNCGFDAGSRLLNRLPVCPCAANHFLHPNVVNVRHRGYASKVRLSPSGWQDFTSNFGVDGVDTQGFWNSVNIEIDFGQRLSWIGIITQRRHYNIPKNNGIY